jgi:hypothetical protein
MEEINATLGFYVLDISWAAIQLGTQPANSTQQSHFNATGDSWKKMVWLAE